MSHSLINPRDTPERQREKLLHIVDVLMRRVEKTTNASGTAYAQFERAAMLEDQVRRRTQDLERTLILLNRSNEALAEANFEIEEARRNLTNAIESVQEGFALFGPDDRLVMCNSRFCMHMNDVRPLLEPGLAYTDHVTSISRSSYLTLPDRVSPEAWTGLRLRQHTDRHVIFNVRLTQDRWLQVSEHRTGDGGTVILQTDVTNIIRLERRERGKLLDDQARIVRATLDHINQGVCIFDPDARLVGWNARAGALLSIPAARFRLGLAFDDLFELFGGRIAPGGEHTEDLRLWVRARGPRPPLRFELRQNDALFLDAFAQEMPDQGFVISFSDVTVERGAIAALSRANETLEARVTARTLELEDALANAERANAARSRFVAAASHDLLQPLSAAKLFVASAADDPQGARAIEALGKAAAALESSEAILGALLDISRLESGRAALSVGPVVLRQILERLADEFAPLALDKGLKLRVRHSDAVVTSDPTYLRRILQNLIGNALRYTTRGGVVVAVRSSGEGKVRVDVTDTGPGIPRSEHANIFREFHRLNARASASEGLGLGLAIVERAAALLNHPLSLASRIGRGTRFTLRLDLAESQAPTPHSSTDEQIAARPLGLIGLIVENDEELREALVLLLEGWGLQALEATSGEEALALIDELGILPDFLIVDDNLGDNRMSGLQMLAQLGNAHGPLPARLMTADRSERLRLACDEANAGLLYKPIDTRALKRFITSLNERVGWAQS